MKTAYLYTVGTERFRKFDGDGDVRGYRAPRGWEVEAFTPERHPITGRPLRYQWWIKETFTGEQ